jgi:hypothetical protein
MLIGAAGGRRTDCVISPLPLYVKLCVLPSHVVRLLSTLVEPNEVLPKGSTSAFRVIANVSFRFAPETPVRCGNTSAE